MWIDRAVKWLLPREAHFFDLIERGAARADEISSLLADCCAATSHAEREAIVGRMHQVEHEADRVIAARSPSWRPRTWVCPSRRPTCSAGRSWGSVRAGGSPPCDGG